MFGYKARNLSAKERNAVGSRWLEGDAAVGLGRKDGTRATGRAHAAHRRRVRRTVPAVAGVLVMAFAMLVDMRLVHCATTMVRFAKARQHSRITAQRQGREQQGEQQEPGETRH